MLSSVSRLLSMICLERLTNVPIPRRRVIRPCLSKERRASRKVEREIPSMWASFGSGGSCSPGSDALRSCERARSART